MVIVSAVVVTGQMVTSAPVVPDAVGIVSIWLWLLPETLGILAPVALLFASVTSAHLWADGGEFRGMASAGLSTRRLIPGSLMAGVSVAVVVAVCTHVLGPTGRGMVRQQLNHAAAMVDLQAGVPVQMGNVWLRAGQGEAEPSSLVVAGPDWVAWAESWSWSSDGHLRLVQGRAIQVGTDWSMSFDGATVPVEFEPIGVHNFERSFGELWALIEAMETVGHDASRERLTIYKRSTLPLAAPLLLLLGLPLGARCRRPAAVTLVVALAVWMVQRFGDHAAGSVGASGMALTPLVLLGITTWVAWRQWREA
jgi:lipopolysaccharide export LptBFGC system permease protein LptF